MKKLRRVSRSELPAAPLEFAYPLAVTAPDAPAAVVLNEVSPPYGLHVLKALRLVLAWSRGPGVSASLFRPDALDAWERSVAALAREQEGLWAAVMVVAGQMRRPARVDRRLLARACLVVVEWALEHDARGTAALFAEAAAVTWPNNPRLAFIAARQFRGQGRPREAERWLDRTVRVAVWNQDVELQAMGLNSLGNQRLQQGDLPGARSLLQAALRLARRERLQERVAKVSHDLMVAAVSAGDLRRADEHARESFRAYGPAHPDVAKLAADVAYLWANQGYFARALQVLTALLPHFTAPDDRLRILVCSARAAGAMGDTGAFERAWAEARALLGTPETRYLTGPAMLELGLGASSLSRWEEAGSVLEAARCAAAESGEAEVVERAVAALDHVRRHEGADRVRRPVAPGPPLPGDVLARELAGSLETQSASAGGAAAPVRSRSRT
jgi:tetratricopeptide (TPR) repeat protein